MSRTMQYRQEIIDALDTIVKGHAAAVVSAHTPSARPSKAGRITGGDVHSDPTGQAAGMTLDWCDAIEQQLRDVRDGLFPRVMQASEFLPGRDWDNGVRRCGEEGCARKHYAVGLCEPHYRRMKRAQEMTA